ncbi:hypothetical protein [Massilia sp. H6]|uniref:hypothetical protein n=1 Tax=Massilia sp. H6 TaxID=2970464 RepID=UPI00216A2EAE|nr:hypothetical protein [Massilia sp. H6]UVW30696.1 hypothetical protein NRS07_20265 [Massilia sp. H6]
MKRKVFRAFDSAMPFQSHAKILRGADIERIAVRLKPVESSKRYYRLIVRRNSFARLLETLKYLIILYAQSINNFFILLGKIPLTKLNFPGNAVIKPTYVGNADHPAVWWGECHPSQVVGERA